MAQALSGPEREALQRLLEAAKLEILPFRSVLAELPVIEPGTTLAVTASPGKGLERSVEFGAELRAAGYEVVVHLAARMVADRAHLGRLLASMRDAGLNRAFVIGGDASPPGEYRDALALLREMADIGHHLREVGIGCHPEGHPSIPDERLLAALREKAPFADYMTTQMCFNPHAITGWLRARRTEGITLPVDIGMPGAVDTARLLRISTRIGVRTAGRFALKQRGLVGRLLRPGGYKPDRLLTNLASILADSQAGVRGLHVFTFNQLERTAAWRRGYLAKLGD
jgi:methylenetetrahydrofolate reductase (NADPH)